MASRDKKPKPRFGEVAVRKGFCTPEQVDQALRIQRKKAAGGRPKPLTGIVMVQHGIISTGQLIDVLRAYQEPDD